MPRNADFDSEKFEEYDKIDRLKKTTQQARNRLSLASRSTWPASSRRGGWSTGTWRSCLAARRWGRTSSRSTPPSSTPSESVTTSGRCLEMQRGSDCTSRARCWWTTTSTFQTKRASLIPSPTGTSTPSSWPMRARPTPSTRRRSPRHHRQHLHAAR